MVMVIMMLVVEIFVFWGWPTPRPCSVQPRHTDVIMPLQPTLDLPPPSMLVPSPPPPPPLSRVWPGLGLQAGLGRGCLSTILRTNSPSILPIENLARSQKNYQFNIIFWYFRNFPPILTILRRKCWTRRRNTTWVSAWLLILTRVERAEYKHYEL